MTWQPDRRLLTLEEAAASVHRPASTIRRWLAEGRLRATGRQGRRALILESDVLEADASTTRSKPRILVTPIGLTAVSTVPATLTP